MSTKRFIKYIPSEKSAWLRQHHTSLYLLLSLAIEQARWSDSIPDGLLPGDAILGNYEKAGISRKQYRLAIETGIELGIWDVVYNQKCAELLKTPKRAIKRTIKSIVVNIKDTTIWDLNLDVCGQQEGQQRANRGPTKGHKQRTEKKVKNVKEEQQPLNPLPSDGTFVVVFFNCLKEVTALNPQQKMELSNLYTEDRIILAIEFFKIEPHKKDAMAGYHWHCQQKIPPVANKILTPEEKITKNKKIAEEILSKYSWGKLVWFEVYAKYAEIVFNGQKAPIVFEYEKYDPDKFSSILESHLDELKIINI